MPVLTAQRYSVAGSVRSLLPASWNMARSPPRPATFAWRPLRGDPPLAFALQDIPSEPQGSTGPSTTTTSSSAPSGTTSADSTAARAEPGLLGSPLFMLMMFVPLIVMMLWSSRSQSKRQQKVLAELKKGDMVLTQGGIRGKLVELGDRYAKVEVAPGSKLEFLKSSIIGKDNAEAAAKIEKR